MKSLLAPQMSFRLRKRIGRAIKRGLTCWKTTSLLAIRNSRPVAWLDITPGWGPTVPRTRTISLGGEISKLGYIFPSTPHLIKRLFIQIQPWADLGNSWRDSVDRTVSISGHCRILCTDLVSAQRRILSFVFGKKKGGCDAQAYCPSG